MTLSELPPRSIFPVQMLRYPNLWFFIDQKLALRGQYAYALRFLIDILEQRLKLQDNLVQGIQNHNLYHLLSNPGEGSDFQARIGPLQRFLDEEKPERSHWHQVHSRFYISPLKAAGMERRRVLFDGEQRDFFLFSASVHYEVATEDTIHPYEDSCPFCGITGEYDMPIDRESQDYCVKIHDPLGLELLLHGSIRGQPVKWEDGMPITSISDLSSKLNCRIDEQFYEEEDPLRLGLVFFLA